MFSDITQQILRKPTHMMEIIDYAFSPNVTQSDLEHAFHFFMSEDRKQTESQKIIDVHPLT